MRWLGRAAVSALAIIGFVVFTATAAAAHATLQLSSPVQSAVYPANSPPETVSLVFDEAVTATPASITLYDGSGKPIHVAAPAGSVTSKQLTVRLPHLTDGTFIVVWHIISDDGHPERGVFTFGVGKGGATTANVGGLVARQSSGRAAGVVFGIDRALLFVSCLVFVGGLWFTRWLWPGGADVGVRRMLRRLLRRLLWIAGVVATATTLLSIPFQAAYTSLGGLSRMFDRSALDAVMRARFGRAAVARAALLVLLLVLLLALPAGRRLVRAFTALAVGALGLGVWATFAYAGHGDTGRLVALGFATDVAHLSAASLWLGGVVVLEAMLRRREELEAGAGTSAAARFSKVALPAIAVVVLSGLTQGWRQIGTWWALWHTGYARLVVLKALLVLAIIVVASAAREVLRTRVVASGRSALNEVRNGIWVEILLAVVVLGITSTLVVSAPGRQAEAAARHAAARTLHLNTAGTQVGYAIDVQPAVAGENTIVVTPRLLRQTGFLPVGMTAVVTETAPAGPSAIPVTFTQLGDGRWVTTAMLRPGAWRLDLSGITDPTSVTNGPVNGAKLRTHSGADTASAALSIG